MNRRDLMKTLAMASILPLSEYSIAAGTTYGCDPNQTNDNITHFIFHGLFFLQFVSSGQLSQIVAASPYLSMGAPQHELVGGQLGHLSTISGNVQINNTGGLQGSVSSFTAYPSIAQFSLTDAQVTADLTKARGAITLPLPAQIIPLRPGNFNDFSMAQGNVQKSIQKYCSQNGNTQLAIGICLRYTSTTPVVPVSGTGPLTLHFFAEPSSGSHKYQDMNKVYSDTKLKDMLSGFDLQLNADPTQTSVPSPDLCSSGISEQDQLSLSEINAIGLWEHTAERVSRRTKDRRLAPPQMENINVANCIPFALNP